VPDTSEIALNAADVEQGVDVVQLRPGLGLLVSHGVHHPVLLPAQPVHRVIPEVAAKRITDQHMDQPPRLHKNKQNQSDSNSSIIKKINITWDCKSYR